MKLPGILFLLGLIIPSFAQNYQLSTYDLDEGLSGGLIKDILTDDIGFVWCATDQGLIRYDGKQAVLFEEEIPGGYAKALFRSREGQFMVLHDFGMTRIISKSDTAYLEPILSGSDVDSDSTLFYPKSIFEDSHGNLWIGENRLLVRYHHGSLKKYQLEDDFAISFSRSYALEEDGWNNLWAFSYNGNLFYYHAGEDSFVPVSLDLDIDQVGALIRISQNTLWACANNGLFEIRVNESQQVQYVKRIGTIENLSSGLVINEHQVMLGSWNEGLYRANIDPRTVTIEKIESYQFPDVVAVHFDQRSGVWVTGSKNTALLKPVFFEEVSLFTSANQTMKIN